jgi:uncharacterized protein
MALWHLDTGTAKLPIALAAALALLATPALADVKGGVEAWEAGDYATAVAAWQAPARAGDADALFNLAQAYRLGRGVEADSGLARKYYAEAAAKGHLKAADNYGLLLFQEGEQEKAMPMVRAAAERGDPRAQYVLGLAHFNGDFAAKDWVRAYALMTLANGAGLPQAAGALGQMDQYIALQQRQQAQSLARRIEEETASQRATALASADLAIRPAAEVRPATRTAQASLPTTRSAPAPAPAPTPVVARVVTPPQQAAMQPAVLVAPAASRMTAASSAASGGNWRVQLGAFGVAANADRLWSQLAGNPALAGTRKALVTGGKVTRLQAIGFASKADAERACGALQKQGQGCLVAGDS